MDTYNNHFKELHTYIQAARRIGQTDQETINILKNEGWSDALISVGFELIARESFGISKMPTPPLPQGIIEIRNIKKEYKNGEEKTVALRGIDLSIQRGEYVAIMGSSGSGKSTLMHILGLLDKPTSGSYKLDGMEVSNLKSSEQSEARSQKIGFVFQQFNLLSRTSVLENVLLPTVYNHTYNAKDRAIELIDRVGLSHRINNKSNQLSGGQIQRVAIARALMMNPEIIFADEPTGNLDSKTSEEILALFREISDNGTTIVLVTHEDEVARHTGRIIRLKDGEIISDERSSLLS